MLLARTHLHGTGSSVCTGNAFLLIRHTMVYLQTQQTWREPTGKCPWNWQCHYAARARDTGVHVLMASSMHNLPRWLRFLDRLLSC